MGEKEEYVAILVESIGYLARASHWITSDCFPPPSFWILRAVLLSMMYQSKIYFSQGPLRKQVDEASGPVNAQPEAQFKPERF